MGSFGWVFVLEADLQEPTATFGSLRVMAKSHKDNVISTFCYSILPFPFTKYYPHKWKWPSQKNSQAPPCRAMCMRKRMLATKTTKFKFQQARVGDLIVGQFDFSARAVYNVSPLMIQPKYHTQAILEACWKDPLCVNNPWGLKEDNRDNPWSKIKWVSLPQSTHFPNSPQFSKHWPLKTEFSHISDRRPQ